MASKQFLEAVSWLADQFIFLKSRCMFQICNKTPPLFLFTAETMQIWFVKEILAKQWGKCVVEKQLQTVLTKLSLEIVHYMAPVNNYSKSFISY